MDLGWLFTAYNDRLEIVIFFSLKHAICFNRVP